MAILSRPKITPDHVDMQLVKKNTNSQKQQSVVAAPVMEADDSVRHPVTKRWTKAYQNSQIAGANEDAKLGQDASPVRKV